MSGRKLTRADDETAPLVAVLNEAMEAKYWKGGDPVAKHAQVNGRWMQVVGVAKQAKYGTLPSTIRGQAPASLRSRELPGTSFRTFPRVGRDQVFSCFGRLLRNNEAWIRARFPLPPNYTVNILYPCQ